MLWSIRQATRLGWLAHIRQYIQSTHYTLRYERRIEVTRSQEYAIFPARRRTGMEKGFLILKGPDIFASACEDHLITCGCPGSLKDAFLQNDRRTVYRVGKSATELYIKVDVP
ncbi:unnamed protein product, partial [marine sediment metagenome]